MYIAFTNEKYPLELPFGTQGLNKVGTVLGSIAPYRPQNMAKGKDSAGMAAMIEHYSYVNMVVTSLGNNGAIVLFKSPILADMFTPVASFTFKPSGVRIRQVSTAQRPLEKRASMKLWTPLEQVTHASEDVFHSTFRTYKCLLGPH